MSSENTFEYAEKVSAKDFADYLVKIAEGFRGGSLELQGKGQAIAMTPEDSVKLEIKAKSKEDGGEMELEISWKHECSTEEDRLEVTPGAAADGADR